MKQPDLSIVVPAYKEQSVITRTLKKLAGYLGEHPEFGRVEVVVVAADGDKTAALAKKQADLFQEFQVVEPGPKVGKGRDVQAGMLAAHGAKRIFTDADLSTPLRHIAPMVELLDRHRVIIGSRNVQGIHKGLRALFSVWGNRAIQALLLPGLKDTQCGFKGFRGDVAEQLFNSLQTKGWAFDLEILVRARQLGYDIHEQPLDDWSEARDEHFRDESSSIVAIKSLGEMLSLRVRLWGELMAKKLGWLRHFVWLTPFIAMGLAAVLYWHQLGKWSIWFDEAFTAEIIKYPLTKIVYFTAHDVHPPLFYFLLKGWAHFFGHTEVGLRSFSMVCMLGAVGMSYPLLSRLFNRHVAVAAMPMVVLAPFLLRYAHEARMYGLATLIGITATYVLVRAVDSKRRIWWVLYALLVIAGLYTHYYTALIWIAHWLWRWYLTRRAHGGISSQLRAFFDRRWVLTHVAIFAAFLPWLPIAISQIATVQSGGFWIGPVNDREVFNVFSTLFLFLPEQWSNGWDFLIVSFILGSAGFVIVREMHRGSRQERAGIVLLLFYALTSLVVLFLVSLPPLRSVFTERYFSETSIAVYLVMGIALALAFRRGTHRFAKSLLYIGIILTLIYGVSNVYTIGNRNFSSLRLPGIKTISEHIDAEHDPKATVLVESYMYYEMDFYRQPGATYFYDSTYQVVRYNSMDMIKNSPQQVNNLTTFGQQHHEIWYVYLANQTAPIPANWKATEQFDAEDFKATKFLVQ